MQKAVAGDFRDLVNSRVQRDLSLRDRLKASYQRKMDQEQQQTGDMSSRIRHLKEVEAQMAEKLRSSKARIQQERGRYNQLMMNRSALVVTDHEEFPERDLSL
jgi:hypothetical protein